MTNFCQYIFKRGVNKGFKCEDTCKDESKFCSKHINMSIPIPIPIPILRVCNDNLNEKIQSLKTTLENKNVILKHYNNMKRLDPTSSEYYKNQMFVDLSLSFPWNKSFDIKTSLQEKSIKAFISNIKAEMDKEIFGMENVKNEILNIVCKIITNPSSNRNIIALCGAAGVAKTKFFQILAKTLDIQMKVIALGGIKDSSFLLGHGYVYVESGPGKIIQNIIDSGISNPIIYFDELDKVSDTNNGKDIYAVLSYLTDPSQNREFTDNYFYGMKFDLSKVLYVFTFNDITKIDKILLDRLNIIHVESPSTLDICHILQNHCIPEIITNIGLKCDIVISQDKLRQIIRTFKSQVDENVSSGVREYYRILEKILLEINKDILLENIEQSPCIIIDEGKFTKYLALVSKGVIESVPNFMYI